MYNIIRPIFKLRPSFRFMVISYHTYGSSKFPAGNTKNVWAINYVSTLIQFFQSDFRLKLNLSIFRPK